MIGSQLNGFKFKYKGLILWIFLRNRSLSLRKINGYFNGNKVINQNIFQILAQGGLFQLKSFDFDH